jgi:hypothetical protein
MAIETKNGRNQIALGLLEASRDFELCMDNVMMILKSDALASEAQNSNKSLFNR